MAIYGIEPPKWIYNRGYTDEHIILFDYVYDLKFTQGIEYIKLESEISLDRYFILQGIYLEAEFKMNLFKYSTDIATVKAKKDEILSYLGLPGTFWLHRDGVQFKRYGNLDALFILHDVSSFYRDNVEYRDGLIIKLKTLVPIELIPISVIMKTNIII